MSSLPSTATAWGRLSARERDCLLGIAALGRHETGPATRSIRDQLPPADGVHIDVDDVHDTLARLDDRGLVEGEPAADAPAERWWLTDRGANLLSEHATVVAESLNMHLAMDGGRR